MLPLRFDSVDQGFPLLYNGILGFEKRASLFAPLNLNDFDLLPSYENELVFERDRRIAG